MDPDYAQRRRVFVAIAITAIAVPAAFLLSRNDTQAEQPITTIVGTVAPPGADASAMGSGQTAVVAAEPERSGTTLDDEVLGTTPTGYLDGTVPPGNATPPRIAIPQPRSTLTGAATFSRVITNLLACYLPAVPAGTTVTLTNVDNGRSVRCQVVAVTGAVPADVVLAADAFAVIADLTEAPVPVEISW